MDRVVGDFVALLRRHRVRVSPAEGLDALEGLRLVGLAEREGAGGVRRSLAELVDGMGGAKRSGDAA